MMVKRRRVRMEVAARGGPAAMVVVVGNEK